MQRRAHAFDHLLLLLQPHQADAKGERGDAPVWGDDVLGEVGGDRREQSTDALLAELCGGAFALEEVGEREGGAQPRASTAGGGAVAEALEYGALIPGHPFDRGGLGERGGAHHQVDLAAHPGGALERA